MSTPEAGRIANLASLDPIAIIRELAGNLPAAPRGSAGGGAAGAGDYLVDH